MKRIKISIVWILPLYIIFTSGCSTSKSYTAWVASYQEIPVNKGELVSIADSSVVLRKDRIYREIRVNNMHKLKFRKKNKFWQSSLIGATSGAIVGAISGYAAGDDSSGCGAGWICIDFSLTAKEKARIGAVGGLIGGAIIGSVIGALKTKIPINGNMGHYKKQKQKLKKYCNCH